MNPIDEAQVDEVKAPSVCAVVVTFNRLGLLQPLLDRLSEIAEHTAALHTIVVVDNASTDGTAQWLRHRAAEDPRIQPVLLAENTGGAGGFHTGLERAMSLPDTEWAWLMDDDGLPDLDCLDRLLEHRSDFDFYGPVVVDRDDPGRLVFPIRLPGGTRVVHRMNDVLAAAQQGVLRDVVIPFNAVLVSRALHSKIGGVREDLFIWGDDHDYRLRAEQAGARIATLTTTRVLHPSVGDLGTPMMWGKTTYNHSPSDLKHYCMARNNLVNLKTYKGPAHAGAFVAKTAWFYAVTRPSWRRLRLSATAMRDGLRGDFTGHRRFL